MKRNISPLWGISAFVAASAFICSGYTFKEFKAAPPVRMNIPAKPDTTGKENPFKIEDMLGSRNTNPYEALGWTTLIPEGDGKMRLAGPAGEPTLNTYSTRLRADKYAKGKLEIKATSRAAVKINGEIKITKSTADSTATAADTQLELLPQADYDILIDILEMPDDKAPAEFVLDFIPDKGYENVTFTGSPIMKKRVQQSTAMKGERVSRNSLSSDGKYLILATTELVSDDETLRKASLRETATGNIVSPSIPTDAQWVDGKSAFTYTAKREGKYDIYVTEVPSMSSSLLASGLPTKDYSLTPDGKYILYYKEIEAEEKKGPMVRYSQPDDRIPGDADRSYIMRYDLDSKVTVPVTYGGPSTMIADISHDGKKLLYMSMRQTPDHYPFYSTTLVEVDMNTLKGDTVISGFKHTMNDAVYSPDATELFIIAGPDAFGGIGANYGDHEIGNDFDGQGYLYNLRTGEARAMTRDFKPALVGAKWDNADGNIYLLGEEGFFQYIYRLDPKSGKITHLPTEIPMVRTYSVPFANKDWIAYTGGSYTKDGEAYVMNLRNGKSHLIAAPLIEYTKDFEFGEMEPWNFTAQDGSVIEGWMCLPPDFDSSKKYPLIVYYYGGTSPSNATFYHNYSPQVFASRGYVVYVLNPSGTTGYGQEFSARHVNAWGKQTADEIIEGTKKFCNDHKFINDKKIGCIGASYGGFMTMYLQTQTDIFAAAVSHAGISNVTSYWGEGFWGYSYNAVAAAKSYPWNNPDLFTKQGALFNADKIHTPILLLHGSEDTNVPIGESIQLFNALKILGRDVEFITVQDENHVIRGFSNRIIWQNTIMAWFAKYLQDDPNWWNALYK